MLNNRELSKISRVFRIVIFAIGLVINLYLIAFLACRDCIPIVAQANYVSHLLLLVPLIIIIPVVLLHPDRRWLAIWLLPGIVALFVMHFHFFLPVRDREATGTEITVATFNMLRLSEDPESVIDVVRDLDTDIVTLYEVNPEVSERLDSELINDYPHQIQEIRGGYEGMVLLSRYPIVDSEIFNNPHPDADIALDTLVYIRSVVDIDGQQIVVFNFHPPIPQVTPFIKYDDTAISYHFETVIDRIRTESLPVILTCDCNTPPTSRQYQWMDRELDEAHAKSGWGLGLTFKIMPSIPFPLVRLDYVWFDEHFTALDAKVWDYAGPSDHRPVWAELDLHRE